MERFDFIYIFFIIYIKYIYYSTDWSLKQLIVEESVLYGLWSRLGRLRLRTWNSQTLDINLKLVLWLFVDDFDSVNHYNNFFFFGRSWLRLISQILFDFFRCNLIWFDLIQFFFCSIIILFRGDNGRHKIKRDRKWTLMIDVKCCCCI